MMIGQRYDSEPTSNMIARTAYPACSQDMPESIERAVRVIHRVSNQHVVVVISILIRPGTIETASPVRDVTP